MKKWFVSSVAVWMAAIGSAAFLIHKINGPLDQVQAADTMPAYAAEPTQAADEPVVDRAEPAVLELPVVTIVGRVRGTAEMQGKDDLIIGPGTVTYP
jgi:hypothetical protein